MPTLRNPRHEKFCELVAAGIKPTEAYTSLKYSPNGAKQAASRLLTNVDVRARVVELQDAAQKSTVEKCAVTRAWVLDSLASVARRCMGAEPIVNANGNQAVRFAFNAAGANRALELLGRELGMFREGAAEPWSGDLNELTAGQQDKLMEQLACRAYPDLPPAEAQEKARAAAEKAMAQQPALQ